MSASDSLDTLGGPSRQDKAFSGSLTVSICASQRKRAPMHPTSSSKENFAAQKKPCSIRRPTKYSRLSDRWPVLSKIIRTAKLAATPQDYPALLDDSNKTSAKSEDQTSPLQPVDKRAASGYLRCNKRVLHRASPEFPSPLSGTGTVERLLLPRHNYAHRGYSQSALHLQQDFWGRRKNEWDEYEYLLYQAGVTMEEAYGGMIEDVNGYLLPLPPHLKRGLWNRRAGPVSQRDRSVKLHVPVFVNLATFPRLGDLSTARDPFLTSVDTWFSDFPLWTLSKMIWMYDLNHRANQTARRRVQGRMNNAFKEDFDIANCSAETLSDASDTTLVDSAIFTSLSPKRYMGDLTCRGTLLKPGLVSLSSSDSLTSIERRVRPWEVNWFSRWEVLYNQVSLAVDIAATYGDPSPFANVNKEAARIILTSAEVFYDPQCDTVKGRTNKTWTQVSAEASDSECCDIVPMEDDEEDYGDVVPPSESIYRLGAQVDPFSMFATATAECGADVLLDISPDDPGAIASCRPRDSISKIADALQHLAVRC